tara:strand:+ start:165 stop:572 length:408 start_codon:yes stop_codon:yes gene_type:complete
MKIHPTILLSVFRILSALVFQLRRLRARIAFAQRKSRTRILHDAILSITVVECVKYKAVIQRWKVLVNRAVVIGEKVTGDAPITYAAPRRLGNDRCYQRRGFLVSQICEARCVGWFIHVYDHLALKKKAHRVGVM